MEMVGTTIQIFLPDSNPKGIKKAKITRDNIEIIQIPRNILSENISLLDFDGIYLLVDSLSIEKPEIYIGKGHVKQRILSHKDRKDFWTTVFAIRLQGDTGFNDAHNSYLEAYFIKTAKNLKRAIMNENKQIPILPKITEEMKSDLDYYTANIKTLLSALGLKCFEPLEDENEKKTSLLYCQDKYGNTGTCSRVSEGFLLHKGAKCKVELHKGTGKLPQRDILIASGLLKKQGEHYVLQDNKIFTSPSTPSSIILGRRSNGWIEWKNEDGKTLDDLERVK